MLGNVDDVALEERDGRLLAVGLLRGPGAWAHRQPGALGRWGRAVWRRLDPREDPRPLVLPLDHVLAIGSAVHVDPWADAFLAGADGLELWLRRHVVGKIPGARGGDHPFGGSLASVPRQDADLELVPQARLLSTPAGRPGRQGRRLRRRSGRGGASRAGHRAVDPGRPARGHLPRARSAPARWRARLPRGPRDGATSAGFGPALVAPTRRRDELERRAVGGLDGIPGPPAREHALSRRHPPDSGQPADPVRVGGLRWRGAPAAPRRSDRRRRRSRAARR